MPADRDDRRRHHRLSLRLPVRVPGAREQEERAVAECVRVWDARVRISSLPAMKGAIVLVEDAGGGFRTRFLPDPEVCVAGGTGVAAPRPSPATCRRCSLVVPLRPDNSPARAEAPSKLPPGPAAKPRVEHGHLSQ